jgi:tyrosyl-tRNA synthetase
MSFPDPFAQFLCLPNLQSSLLSEIQTKLSTRPDFLLLHSFEPNGRLTVAHALRYVAASRATASLGGRYLLLIDDLGASQRLVFDRNESLISAAAEYALHVFRVLGVLGAHATVVRSSELALPNTEIFLEMIANSITVSAKQVQDSLPPLGKKEVLTASQLIAPCLHATEVLHLGADFVVTPINLAPQASLLKKFREKDPPVVLPLPLILNLKGAKSNPPKPDPKNVFFFEDTSAVIAQKANGAFCTDATADNPVFQYVAFVLIPFAGSFSFAGKTYTSGVGEFEADFAALDKKALKGELAKGIDAIVGPVRESLAAADVSPAVKTAASFTTTTQ